MPASFTYVNIQTILARILSADLCVFVSFCIEACICVCEYIDCHIVRLAGTPL